MTALVDITRQKIGRWTVIGRASNYKTGSARWLCRCECGRERTVRSCDLLNGKSSQCINCGNKANSFKHGLTGTRLFNIWRHIISRCEYSNNKDYKYYGERGISICQEWRKDFKVFYKWALVNGYKDDLTIDRIDNDRGYSSDNCQWITQSENSLKAWHVDGSHGGK